MIWLLISAQRGKEFFVSFAINALSLIHQFHGVSVNSGIDQQFIKFLAIDTDAAHGLSLPGLLDWSFFLDWALNP